MSGETAEQYLARCATLVNARLTTSIPGDDVAPAVLHKAMRYSLLGGGKRLRPALVLAAGEACGAAPEALLPIACAVEMIHTYSLIHDDLPAMDDDDLRRGRPTCHKVFGEAMAILAGDALFTHAFLTLAEAPVPDGARASLVAQFARAAGAGSGMVGGQAADLLSEGKAVSLDDVAAIHRAKTGALIRASAVAGGIAAGAEPVVLDALAIYGEKIGLAFQIVDDVLDLTATAEELGKTPGKDADASKATFPAVLGVEKASSYAQDLLDEALDALTLLGANGERLRQIARFITSRRG